MAVKEIDQNLSQKGGISSFSIETSRNGLFINRDVYYEDKINQITLVVKEKVIQQIEEHAQISYPNEIGGIYIGYHSEEKPNYVYIFDILTPDIYANSPIFFQPEHNTLNQKLAEVEEKYKGQIYFVGEWHTHPEMSNQFSFTDFLSIRKVAKSRNVFIDNPILSITSIKKGTFDHQFYIYGNNRMYKFTQLN